MAIQYPVPVKINGTDPPNDDKNELPIGVKLFIEPNVEQRRKT